MTIRSGMRLGITYLIVCDVRDGQYTTAAPFARWIEALYPYFDDIRLILPVSRNIPLERAGYPLPKGEKIEVVELPPIYHLSDFFRDYYKHRSILRKSITDCDLVNVRPPNFLSLLAGEECMRANKPFFLTLVGDYNHVIRDENYQGIKRIFGNILMWNHEKRLRRLLANSYTMALGGGLYGKYSKFAKKMDRITTTTVSKEDLYEREDTCQNEAVRALTVAVMQGYKGIPYLLDAAVKLKKKGRKIDFDLLGTGSRLEDYRKEAKAKGVDDIVHFHGHIEYGPKLFEFYHNSDMFILPSTGAEGTPRVVTEAMSQCLPVIVTKVGGNPGTVEDGDCGALIEPGDPDAIVGAIEQIIDDGEYRRGIIRKGFERVKGFTMDHHSKDVYEKLKGAFPEMFNNRPTI